MPPGLRQSVRERACGRCEYCHFRETHLPYWPFHLEHIVARQHGGVDDAANLAWACPRCNACKGTNLSAVDPDSAEIVRLFNPRSDRWAEHFALRGNRIIGLTTTCRVTVWLLQMNTEARLKLRGMLLDDGLW